MDVSYTAGALDVTVDGSFKRITFKNFRGPNEENLISNVVYDYSPNQRKTIIAKTEKLIDTYDTGDCPTRLHFLLAALKKAG